MDLIIAISMKIIIVGWALCMIIWFFVLLILLSILLKFNYVANDIVKKYKLVEELISLPLKLLQNLTKE